MDSGQSRVVEDGGSDVFPESVLQEVQALGAPLLIMVGPHVLSGFVRNTSKGEELLPRVVPDVIRMYFGLHWTCYDKIWAEASSQKTTRLVELGRDRYRELLRAASAPKELTEACLDPKELWELCPSYWHVGNGAHVALTKSKTQSFTEPDEFIELFWAWFGAAVECAEGSSKDLRERRELTKFTAAVHAHHAGGRLAARRTPADIVDGVLDIMGDVIADRKDEARAKPGKAGDVGVAGKAKTKVTLDGRSRPASIPGAPVYLVPPGTEGTLLGNVDRAHPRGFVTTEKICEACRLVLASSVIGANAPARCTGCNVVWYCCKEHQKLDWKSSHKYVCSQALKEYVDKNGGTISIPLSKGVLDAVVQATEGKKEKKETEAKKHR